MGRKRALVTYPNERPLLGNWSFGDTILNSAPIGRPSSHGPAGDHRRQIAIVSPQLRARPRCLLAWPLLIGPPCFRPNLRHSRQLMLLPIADVWQMGQRRGMKGQFIQRTAQRELLAFAGVSMVVLTYLAVIWETRPPSISIGRVVGFGLLETDGFGRVGSVNRATVDLPRIGIVVVSLPDGAPCRTGSAIEVEEHHVLLGSSFRAGPRNCFVPAVVRPSADSP